MFCSTSPSASGYRKETLRNSISPFIPGWDWVTLPSWMEERVSSTSKIRLAATLARGRMIKIITNIIKAMTTCMAYWEKTIMSEKMGNLSANWAFSTR